MPIAVPTGTLTGAGWTGTTASLADLDDLTYIQSPSAPTGASPVEVNLGTVVDPGTDSGFVLRVTGYKLSLNERDVVCELRNQDDSSVVTQQVCHLTEGAQRFDFPLS